MEGMRKSGRLGVAWSEVPAEHTATSWIPAERGGAAGGPQEALVCGKVQAATQIGAQTGLASWLAGAGVWTGGVRMGKVTALRSLIEGGHYTVSAVCLANSLMGAMAESSAG